MFSDTLFRDKLNQNYTAIRLNGKIMILNNISHHILHKQIHWIFVSNGIRKIAITVTNHGILPLQLERRIFWYVNPFHRAVSVIAHTCSDGVISAICFFWNITWGLNENDHLNRGSIQQTCLYSNYVRQKYVYSRMVLLSRW